MDFVGNSSILPKAIFRLSALFGRVHFGMFDVMFLQRLTGMIFMYHSLSLFDLAFTRFSVADAIRCFCGRQLLSVSAWMYF